MNLFKSPTVVVGSGRSGTSIVANMLNKLGIHMGDDLIPADSNNVAGTYEDKDFALLNETFLDGKMSEEKFVEQAKRLIQAKGVQLRKWGWKHPTTSNLIEHYKDIVPDAKYIWCGRPAKDSIKSYIKAYGWEKDKAEALVSVRLKVLSEHLGFKNPNVLSLEFKKITKDPERTVDKIINFLGLNPTDKQRQDAIDVVYDKSKTEKAKVLVVTPSKNVQLHGKVHQAIMQMDKDKRYDVETTIKQGSPISDLRNKIVKFFLEGDWDFLIMLDDDVVPVKNPLDLIELNKDIVGLPTPIYNSGQLMFNAMINVGKGFKPVVGRLQQGLMEIDAIGTGCIVIKREVLEDFNNPFGEEWDEKGFKTRGEDFAFCMRAKEQGYKIWTHWDYPCEHWNTVNLLKVLEGFRKLE